MYKSVNEPSIYIPHKVMLQHFTVIANTKLKAVVSTFYMNGRQVKIVLSINSSLYLGNQQNRQNKQVHSYLEKPIYILRFSYLIFGTAIKHEMDVGFDIMADFINC